MAPPRRRAGDAGETAGSESRAVAPEVSLPAPGAGVLVSVFSGTGGVGNTLVTANLAAAVARLTSSRVLVVDLDLMFGDQAAVLGQQGGPTVSDLLDGEPVDLERVQDVILSTPAGVDLLAAPKEPEHADMMMPGFVIQCLELVRSRYDWIFCDTARLIQEISLSLLEMVQIPIYVLSPEVCAVKNASRWLGVMEKWGMPVERVQLLFNKVDPVDESTIEFLEEKFRKKALGRLPMESRSARDSLNRGKVLALQDERGPLGDALETVAATLAGHRRGTRGQALLLEPLDPRLTHAIQLIRLHHLRCDVLRRLVSNVQKETCWAFLVAASLVFYGWWNWRFIALILAVASSIFTVGSGWSDIHRSGACGCCCPSWATWGLWPCSSTSDSSPRI